MVASLSETLSTQMEWSAVQSEIVVLAQARLDSLETLPFSSLSTGTSAESVTVRGRAYTLTTTITSVTAMLLQVDLTLAPTTGSTGPSYATRTYVADNW